MQAPLPEYERNKIIDLYLDGTSPQSEIALRVGRSEGTVSNVISTFIRQFGQRDVKAMRTMAVAKQKTGITAEQCVQGFRILRRLSAIGIPTDESGNITIASLESYINNIFQAARNAGLAEDKVAEYAKQLFEISVNETIEPARVPQYIEEKLKHKKQLDSEADEIVERINALNEQEKKKLQDSKTTEADLEEYTFARDELKKCDCQIQDIPKLVNMLNNAEGLGYNATKMAAKLSEEESIEQKIQKDAGVLNQLENDIAAQAKSLHSLNERVGDHQDVVNEINELNKIGCGVEELQVLRDTIISMVNATATGKQRISPQKAFKRFIRDVERNYDKVHGFENTEKELNKLSKQYAKLEVDVSLLEQRKMETENYINKTLVEFTKNIASFITSFGISQGKIDAVAEKIDKTAKGSPYDLEFVLLRKRAGVYENVLRAYYNRGHINVEDLMSPLYIALEVMIRKLGTYAANELYVKQEEVYQLRQLLRKAKDELGEFERKLGLSFDDEEAQHHQDAEA